MRELRNASEKSKLENWVWVYAAYRKKDTQKLVLGLPGLCSHALSLC